MKWKLGRHFYRLLPRAVGHGNTTIVASIGSKAYRHAMKINVTALSASVVLGRTSVHSHRWLPGKRSSLKRREWLSLCYSPSPLLKYYQEASMMTRKFWNGLGSNLVR